MARLAATGRPATVSVEAGGTLLPGASAGILSTGNLDLVAGASFEVEFGGTTPGIGGYDQVKVTGTVSLGGASLLGTFLGSFVPTPGDQFTIIDNDGGDPVSGIFAGLAEGATFDFGQDAMIITYGRRRQRRGPDDDRGQRSTGRDRQDDQHQRGRGTTLFTVADFGFSDPNDTPANALVAVVISYAAGGGGLTLDGVPVTAGAGNGGLRGSTTDISAN